MSKQSLKQKSLEIFDQILSKGDGRQKRLTELMRPVDGEDCGWAMFVPACFNDALDIRQTERVIKKEKTLQWTQGAMFSFSTGDILYDTPKAYEKWSKALGHIHLCIHVTSAESVSLVDNSTQRVPGKVTFDLLVPNESGSSLLRKSTHDITQDEFVRLLIYGSSAQITLTSPDTLF